MRPRPQILIADDNPENLEILQIRLAACGYDVVTAGDGREALRVAREALPDLILLDIMMPKMDGIEVCRTIRQDRAMPFVPIIMITAKSDPEDVVVGLEAGADEYLTKPVDQIALVARVKSMLRIKELHDKSQEQTLQLSDWNQRLEERVAEQSAELQRIGQLKRFFPPQLVDSIVSSGDQDLMKSHRREITAVFCDLQGFTSFAETAEPEDIIEVMREYHNAIGPLTFRYGATIEHFVGDGLTAYFNDPIPCPDPAARAVHMALAMHEEVGRLIEAWTGRGYDLGFKIGVALGYATLGQFGFEGQFHYGAIGSVLNLASRLCDRARHGETLITQRVYAEVEDLVEATPIGEVTLKGFRKPITALNAVRMRAVPHPGPDHPPGGRISPP